MSNLWLLSKMRQPSRPIFTDFTETTFPKILDELLSEKNFLLDRNIAGTRMIVPKWEHCLEYEYQVRSQAIKLCVRKGYSFQSAWWTVHRDVEHRMEHWMQLLTIANSSSEVAQLRREVERLRQSVRSRSPRVRQGQGTQLTLSDQPFDEPAQQGDKQNKRKRKDRSDNRWDSSNSKGRGKKVQQGQGAADSGTARSSKRKSFREILRDTGAKTFLTMNHQKGRVCWSFQMGTCSNPNCERLHECSGCGTPGIGCDACRCQAAQV